MILAWYRRWRNRRRLARIRELGRQARLLREAADRADVRAAVEATRIG